MFCKECGHKMNENDVFCEECGYQNVTKKEFKKPSLKVMIIIGAIVLLVGSFMYLDTITNSNYVAKSFCKNLKQKNYDKIFKLTNYEKSKFLTKDKYKETITSSEEIVSCEIKETTSVDNNNKRFTLNIKNKEGREQTLRLNVEKTDKKQLLLFDKWAIKNNDTVEKWEIRTPLNSKLYVENVEIKNKTENAKYLTFTVEKLFNTEYEIKVTNPLLKEYKGEKSPNKYSYTLVSMESSKELTESANDVVTKLYEIALYNKELSELSSFVDEDYIEKAEILVQNLKNQIDSSVSYITKVSEYKNVVLKNPVASNVEILSKDEVKLRITYDLNYEYKLEDSEEFKTKTRKYYITIGLKIDNGQFILNNKY